MPSSFWFYDLIATTLWGYQILHTDTVFSITVCQQAELKFTKAQLDQAELLTVTFSAEQKAIKLTGETHDPPLPGLPFSPSLQAFISDIKSFDCCLPHEWVAVAWLWGQIRFQAKGKYHLSTNSDSMMKELGALALPRPPLKSTQLCFKIKGVSVPSHYDCQEKA